VAENLAASMLICHKQLVARFNQCGRKQVQDVLPPSIKTRTTQKHLHHGSIRKSNIRTLVHLGSVGGSEDVEEWGTPAETWSAVRACMSAYVSLSHLDALGSKTSTVTVSNTLSTAQRDVQGFSHAIMSNVPSLVQGVMAHALTVTSKEVMNMRTRSGDDTRSRPEVRLAAAAAAAAVAAAAAAVHACTHDQPSTRNTINWLKSSSGVCSTRLQEAAGGHSTPRSGTLP
jgi:hypothetical protein